MNSASVRFGGSLRSVNWQSTPYGLLKRISMPERTTAARGGRRCLKRGAASLAVGVVALLEDLVAGGRLDELQRHAIRLADREVLVLVLVAELERRRQRPDALLVILRVLRIGVDL